MSPTFPSYENISVEDSVQEMVLSDGQVCNQFVRELDFEEVENCTDPYESSSDEYVPEESGEDSEHSSIAESYNHHPTREAQASSEATSSNTNLLTRREGRRREKNAARSRKRQRNPSNWERNVRKALKTQGKEYIWSLLKRHTVSKGRTKKMLRNAWAL